MAGEAPQVGSGDEIVRPLHHICATAALECRPAPVYMLIHMWVVPTVSALTRQREGERERERALIEQQHVAQH